MYPFFLQAITACFATIVMMQVVNVFLCRHPLKPSLSFGPFSNPLILLGIAAEIGSLLFIVYTRAGNCRSAPRRLGRKSGGTRLSLWC